MRGCTCRCIPMLCSQFRFMQMRAPTLHPRRSSRWPIFQLACCFKILQLCNHFIYMCIPMYIYLFPKSNDDVRSTSSLLMAS
uniref:Uncharacterized protein n=1 Tax=Arundo donax TaxID=35708 RepID=A0A0A9GL36_ARUDO